MTPTAAAAGLAVRPARAEDAAGIAQVEAAAWRDAYAGLLPEPVIAVHADPERRHAWRRRLGASGPELAFVAEDKDGVVGFASFGPTRDAAARRAGYTGEVYTLYVLPERQRLGLGRALFTEARDCLIASGRFGVMLWMLKDGPAGPFYRRLGGRALWRRPTRLLDHPIDEVAFGWREGA